VNELDIPRFVYLVGLLLLVSGGLFAAYRHRLAQGMQHAAIWALIFLGVVIAYGFQDILGAQLSRAPVTQLSPDAVALRRGADGHFHATLEINGRRVAMLVDTGASDIVLSAADARRVGLDPAQLVFSRRAATANGVVALAPVTLDSLRLGPFEDRNVPAAVNGGPMRGSLLGLAYLDRFARLRVENDRMILER